MKRLVVSFIAIGVGLIYFLGISSPAVMAAANPSAGTGQALEIAPPLLTLTANPGQTLNAQIKLRDVTKSNLVVTNEINDFVAEGESGIPKILLGNDSDNPFSLKDWVTPLPQFMLAPQKVHTLSVTIKVPKNASPGGHYGVIRFSGVPPELSGTGVSLSASLGTLVLLTVNGKITHSLTVQQFSTTKVPPKNSTNETDKPTSMFEATPINFVVRLKNNGNIQEEPGGRIIISDMFGKIVAGVNINVPPHNVLPDSIRKFTGTLDSTSLGTKKLFGLYHAKLTVNYGTDSNDKKMLTKTIMFWVIPWKLIVSIVIGLIIAFFVLRFLIRRYNRRIISRVQNGQIQTRHPKQHKRRRK